MSHAACLAAPLNPPFNGDINTCASACLLRLVKWSDGLLQLMTNLFEAISYPSVTDSESCGMSCNPLELFADLHAQAGQVERRLSSAHGWRGSLRRRRQHRAQLLPLCATGEHALRPLTVIRCLISAAKWHWLLRTQHNIKVDSQLRIDMVATGQSFAMHHECKCTVVKKLQLGNIWCPSMGTRNKLQRILRVSWSHDSHDV